MKKALLGVLLAVGCTGAAPEPKAPALFSPEWQDDGGKSFRAVYERVKDAKLPEGVAVAVGVTSQGLVGIGLDGSGKWSYATLPDARPVISGNVVVGSGGGSVFALEAKSGKELWRLPSGGRSLRGAGDDGSFTVASLGKPRGDSFLLAVARDGKVLIDLETGVEIGQPGVQGGVAFVPWGSQYVSALDLSSRKELGRWVAGEPVSNAINIGGQLWFGERSLTPLDAELVKNAPRRIALPARELPGKPSWLDDGRLPTLATATARSRVRLYARPIVSGERARIESNRFSASYYRVAMGLDAEAATLKWVKSFERDLIGGAATHGGFALCDSAGKIWLLDEAGGNAGGAELGRSLSACVVQAGNIALPNGTPPPALSEQIVAAIRIREEKMAPAQRFLLQELGAIQAPLVTKSLIDLVSDPRTPTILIGDARTQLAQRRTGAEYMLDALKRHYDFLGDVLRPPPVGPLADALAAINETRAAPLLASHLNDPANSADDIERTARALAKLATAAEAEELRTFFALYRATADQRELVSAVVSVAEALLRVGGDDADRIVRRAIEDPLTNPQVKSGLEELIVKTSGQAAPT